MGAHLETMLILKITIIYNRIILCYMDAERTRSTCKIFAFLFLGFNVFQSDKWFFWLFCCLAALEVEMNCSHMIMNHSPGKSQCKDLRSGLLRQSINVLTL